eukprot:2551803-Pleurochrysis_carterae.AAC.1
MKTEKISCIETHLPKKRAFSIQTRTGDLPLHMLCVMSGRRGGGKSVAAVNLLRDYKEKGYHDCLLLITPTFSSDCEIWDIAGIQEEQVYEPVTGVIRRITEFVENERSEWDEYCGRRKQWRNVHKKLRKGSDGFISDAELLEAHSNGLLNSQPPKWKLKHERPARIACVLDDDLSTPLMCKPSEGLVNLCIKHRHIGGSGMGLSLFLIVQSYSCQGGLNRCIRENTTA